MTEKRKVLVNTNQKDNEQTRKTTLKVKKLSLSSVTVQCGKGHPPEDPTSHSMASIVQSLQQVQWLVLGEVHSTHIVT